MAETVDTSSAEWKAVEHWLRRAMDRDLRELAEAGTLERRADCLRGRIELAGAVLRWARPEQEPDLPADAVVGIDPDAGY